MRMYHLQYGMSWSINKYSNAGMELNTRNNALDIKWIIKVYNEYHIRWKMFKLINLNKQLPEIQDWYVTISQHFLLGIAD